MAFEDQSGRYVGSAKGDERACPARQSEIAVSVGRGRNVVRGQLAGAVRVGKNRRAGDVTVLGLCRAAVGTATVKVSAAAVELGPPAAAWVAETVWLALLKGEVGVKLQALLTTAAVPATVPSIETVTVSPLTPVPAIAGSAVVVSVLPLAGLAMVGAAGAVGTATVKVSVAAVELGPPEAACVAEIVWLALLRGEVGV